MFIDTEKQSIPGFTSMANVCFFLFLFTLFVSCKQKNNDIKSKSGPREVIPKKINKPKVIEPDTILNATTGYVEGHRFVITCHSNGNLFVVNDKGNTVYKDSTYSPRQEFVDFNGDGYKDILIEYLTNVPGIYDLLLYNKVEKTYKKVVDLRNFPAAERIGRSGYYYSYHRSGCADMNWGSDLFYIENYKTIKIGNISGHECGNTGVKDGIYINKIRGEKKTEVAELPINTIKRYKNYKWGFIEQYWHKNYKRFI